MLCSFNSSSTFSTVSSSGCWFRYNTYTATVIRLSMFVRFKVTWCEITKVVTNYKFSNNHTPSTSPMFHPPTKFPIFPSSYIGNQYNCILRLHIVFGIAMYCSTYYVGLSGTQRNTVKN
jgi:hypothetical protein